MDEIEAGRGRGAGLDQSLLSLFTAYARLAPWHQGLDFSDLRMLEMACMLMRFDCIRHGSGVNV